MINKGINHDLTLDDYVTFDVFTNVLLESLYQQGSQHTIISHKDHSITLRFNDEKRVKIVMNNDDEEQPYYIITNYHVSDNMINITDHYYTEDPCTITESTCKMSNINS